MYRSRSYASQAGKSAFVEMSERSAEAAKLIQRAGDAELAPPEEQVSSLARRVWSQGVHLLEGLGRRVSQLRGVPQG